MKSENLKLLDSAAWPVLLVDGSGRILRANSRAADVLGAVVRGESPNLSSIWSDVNDTKSVAFIAKLAQTPVSTMGITFLVKGGESSKFLTYLNPVVLDGQRFVLFQLLSGAGDQPSAAEKNPLVETNIQQRQKLDCAFQMARSVALDFNNALTSILGHTSLMLTRLPADSEWRRSLLEMERSAERAAEIATDLASFSRQEKDSRASAAGNLNVLLRQTCELFHAKPGPPIEWNMRLETKLYAAHLDEAKILQSLTKMMENAVESLGSAGGVIEVISSNHDLHEGNPLNLAPGQYVGVEVSDNGEGMSQEVLSRVFEPFYTTRPGHRGLGLAWVYGIVTNHGGIVAMASEEGKGTRLQIFLPATRKQLTEGFGRDEELRGDQTVLLVDDEELILTLGETVLSTYGYRVLTASSGEKALKVFEDPEAAIDLLISDMVMPQMSGRELIDRVKKTAPNTRVLSCSGFVQTSKQDDKLYLKKPFTSQQLLRKVKQVLG